MLLEEDPLRASVAFAKRMDGVDLGEIMRQAIDEVGALEPAKMILGDEVRQELGRLLLDVLRSAERMRAREFAGADLAGPRIHILEDGVVESLEVREVVGAGKSVNSDRLLAKQRGAALGVLQLDWVGDAEPVAQASGGRVYIGVMHSLDWRSYRALSGSPARWLAHRRRPAP